MDTIYALSSGRPPAAVSIIRVSGPQAHSAGRQLAGTLGEPRTASVRELREPRTGDLLDEALVLRFDAPSSATGEDVIEFHCHGGRAVVDALLAALGSLDGLREAQPGEFTRRTFENGRIDLTEAEGLADLLEAETESQRKASLALAEGGLSRQIRAWQERLLAASAAAELAIDYDDEDSLALDPALVRDCQQLTGELGEWLARPRVEALKDGVKVVVAGPPNAGKSSLINALVGTDRAIVTEVPGTTRDAIEVPIALAGNPVVMVDTAGLRDTDGRVEAIGVGRSLALIEQADIVVWLGAPSEAPAHPQLIAVHARADLPDRHDAPAGSLAVSSVTGAGLASLLERISALAATILPHGDAIALNRRQAALLDEAASAVGKIGGETDLVVVAELLRQARASFDRLTGRAGVEDVLDTLFGRFCLGK